MDLEALLAALAAEQLPATADELNQLLAATTNHVHLFQARVRAGQSLTVTDTAQLRSLLDGRDKVNDQLATTQAQESGDAQELADLLARAEVAPAAEVPVVPVPPVAPEAPPVVEATPEAEAAVVAEAEAAAAAAADAPPVVVAAGGVPAVIPPAPVSFAGLGGGQAPPATPVGPGWRMKLGAPGYKDGPVGFHDLALGLESVRGSRKARNAGAVSRGGHFAQVIADLPREVKLLENGHDIRAELERLTRTLPDGTPVTAESLVAAGGWCAPSETLYTFCDVPAATDLLSVPEITINRGGVRWPVEPDLTSIFANFQWFFTEPQLEALDGTQYKDCIVIPCPDEFEELRLSVIGYCVEAGILQTQGWPELIEWFMQQLVAEHLRAVSRRSIIDIVNGSTLNTFLAADLIGTAGAVLNSLALSAYNIRTARGLGANAVIEGFAPTWLAEVLKADVAYYQGIDTKNVTTSMVLGWLSARNIALQFVGDWQTRDTGLPGNLGTIHWPTQVDVALYPAGTWFRAMQPVIEVGVMYPKEQLQGNTYTRMFTEDAIAIGRRCHPSTVVRIPITVDGTVGARKSITVTPAPTASGIDADLTPVPSGQFGLPVAHVLAVTGAPTGGVAGKITADGHPTANIPWNATATQLDTLLAALPSWGNDEFEVTGGPLPATAITVKTRLPVSLGSVALTGGTTPGATLT